jgi:ADP-ribosylglycohydrolase
MPSKSNPSTSNTKPLLFLTRHPFVRTTILDKIHGCIFGSALGDTIGSYTEFLTKEQSEEIYGNKGFQLVEPATKAYADEHRCT